MEHEVLEERIMTQGEAVQKMELLLSKDHEETIKQRHQINTLCFKVDILFAKIGSNGWSQKVEGGIDELKERILLGEKTDIERKAEISLLNSKLDVVLESLTELKNRPKERISSLKDRVYLIIGFLSISSVLISSFTWLVSQGNLPV